VAIDVSTLRMLLRSKDRYKFGGDLLTLGVADVHGTYDDMERVLRENNVPHSPIPPSQRKVSLTKRQSEFSLLFGYSDFMHQNDLFKMMGFNRTESMDVFDNEDPTYVHDLNTPVPESLHNKFDTIMDFGTLDHVYDMRTAIANVVNMLKVGGVVVIYDAMIGWHNQSYYNFQPPFFLDTFAAYGFSDPELFIHYYPKYGHGRKSKTEWREYRHNDEINFRKPFHYTACYFTARKAAEVRTDKFLMNYYIEHHVRTTEDAAKKELAEQPSFIAGAPRIVQWAYPYLASVFRYVPNFLRVLLIDHIIFKLANSGKYSDRLKLWF
jgi:hypothetical protein